MHRPSPESTIHVIAVTPSSQGVVSKHVSGPRSERFEAGILMRSPEMAQLRKKLRALKAEREGLSPWAMARLAAVQQEIDMTERAITDLGGIL